LKFKNTVSLFYKFRRQKLLSKSQHITSAESECYCYVVISQNSDAGVVNAAALQSTLTAKFVTWCPLANEIDTVSKLVWRIILLLHMLSSDPMLISRNVVLCFDEFQFMSENLKFSTIMFHAYTFRYS